MYICIYVFTQERIYVKLYRRIYVYTYVCIYVYMYIHNAAFTQDKYGMYIWVYVYMGSACRTTNRQVCQAIHAGKRFQKIVGKNVLSKMKTFS